MMNDSHETATFIAFLGEEQKKLLPKDMPEDAVQQCWFRFLYLLGNPAEIPNPAVFDSSPKFREFVSKFGPQLGIVEPSEHHCLTRLPFCFFRAMCAVSSLVGVFLGRCRVFCRHRHGGRASSETLVPPAGPLRV